MITKDTLTGTKFCTDRQFHYQYRVLKVNEDGLTCTIVTPGGQVVNNGYDTETLLMYLNDGSWSSEVDKPGINNSYSIY